MRRRQLLILEHEALARWGAAAELRRLGHEIIEAHSVEEAISVFESGTPIDLVLCDADIPGPQSGLEFERWLARNEPGVPVLLTSVDASGIPPLNNRSMRSFMLKPYASDVLLIAVDGLLDLRPDESSDR